MTWKQEAPFSSVRGAGTIQREGIRDLFHFIKFKVSLKVLFTNLFLLYSAFLLHLPFLFFALTDSYRCCCYWSFVLLASFQFRRPHNKFLRPSCARQVRNREFLKRSHQTKPHKQLEQLTNEPNTSYNNEVDEEEGEKKKEQGAIPVKRVSGRGSVLRSVEYKVLVSAQKPNFTSIE